MRPTRVFAVLSALSSALLLTPLSPISLAHAQPTFFWANPTPTGSALGGVEFESASVGYAVGRYSTVLRSTDSGLTWHDLSALDAASPHFDDVLVVSPGTLLAAGSTPGIFRSTNSGESWSPVANPSTQQLHNLFALDASTFYAVGDLGTVIRSTNAGASWSLFTAPSTADIVDQWWQDSLRGIVVGEFVVRRTTDGGATWSTIPGIPESASGFPGDVQFLDATNGWIFLDFVTYRTTNGGASWFALPGSLGEFPIYQEEALVMDAQTRLIATEAEGADILKTTSDGASWVVTFRHNGTRGITDLERIPGGAIIATSTDGDVLRSTDEGATWTNFTHVAGPPTRANGIVLEISDAFLGFAGGYSDLWIQTTNSGISWFTPPADPGLAIVNAICIRDPSFILAGGTGTTGQSDVRRSTNGGATWTTHSLSANYVGYPQSLVAFDDGTCYTATYGGDNIGTVYRSTDFGQTWHPRNTGLSGPRLFNLFFLDVQTGFACGGDFGNPAISRTTNGGAQWTPVGEAGLASDMVRDMHWFSLNEGFVVDGSSVKRTTNGGASWTTMSANVGEHSIDFYDAMRGVTDAFPHDVGVTTDGGLTWTRIALPMDGFIGDVSALGNDFYVLGGSNAILGGDTDGPPVAVTEIASGAAAGKFIVWPNPLRAGEARTVYFKGAREMSSGDASPIDARLFDVRGRMLARERVVAGGLSGERGQVSLPLASISPGVYFLELRQGGGVHETHKLTVVR